VIDLDERNVEFRRFPSDHPGTPLGRGYPIGRTLRLDGETHLGAWSRIVRNDPCSFCGRAGGTADHIVPQDPLVPDPAYGKYTWFNLAGACESCNASKGNSDLITFLYVRASVRPRLLRAA
jgi:5-methylcytosine-specific restriction endonuclease McrA